MGAPTLEEERVLISHEVANLRTLARDCPDRDRPCLVSKLLALHTLGFDAACGQMEVVSLMGHERQSYKRWGYLAAGQLFDERNERLVLGTATIQKDLTHASPAVQRMALSFVANTCTQELGQAIAPAVIRLMSSPNHLVQKCAVMAAMKIHRKCPELTDDFRPLVAGLFNSTCHSMVTLTPCRETRGRNLHCRSSGF
jgi:AP-1 complex subunit gamma-1